MTICRDGGWRPQTRLFSMPGQRGRGIKKEEGRGSASKRTKSAASPMERSCMTHAEGDRKGICDAKNTSKKGRFVRVARGQKDALVLTDSYPSRKKRSAQAHGGGKGKEQNGAASQKILFAPDDLHPRRGLTMIRGKRIALRGRSGCSNYALGGSDCL